jgi:hypothetical protein
MIACKKIDKCVARLCSMEQSRWDKYILRKNRAIWRYCTMTTNPLFRLEGLFVDPCILHDIASGQMNTQHPSTSSSPMTSTLDAYK